MNIKILFDNKVSSRGYVSGWGFSALIDDRILFDTGCDGKKLLKNIRKMKVDIKKITGVVISHNHWDHRGGLRAILERTLYLDVWLGKEGFNPGWAGKKEFHGKCIRHPGFFSEVDKNIFTTGEIMGRFLWKKIPEQSLVLKSDNGLTVITGCAHSGIIKILETVQQKFKERICLVVGGFHLLNRRRSTISTVIQKFKEMGVVKVAPCHCTGKTAISMFRKAFGSHFILIGAGDSLSV